MRLIHSTSRAHRLFRGGLLDVTAELMSHGGEQFIREVRMCFIVWCGQIGCKMKRLYLSGAEVLATKTAFAQSAC